MRIAIPLFDNLTVLDAIGPQRVVEQGHVLTAAGVSAGLDVALVLAARLAGTNIAQSVQLALEYDPQPPFDSGSPDRAPDTAVAFTRATVAAREARTAHAGAPR